MNGSSWPAISRYPLQKGEWLTAGIIALLASILFILPYLLGHTLSPPDSQFTGLLINVEDGSYLSAIQQGIDGQWTYRNLFTTEAHEGSFIQGFYLASGHLGRWFNLSATETWHLALFLADLALFLTLFSFLGLFLNSRAKRLVAYLLAIFGAGYDWWEFPVWLERANTLEALPLDQFMPEAHIFYSALTYPHFSLGITLIILVFWWSLRALSPAQKPDRRWLFAILAGSGNLALGVVYPFLILVTASVSGVYFLYICRQAGRILWRSAFKLAVAFLIPIPLFLYYAVVLLNNDVMRTWNAQAVTLSPNPLHYLLTYAPYLVLGIWTLRNLSRRPAGEKARLAFLWIWLGCVAILLYLPLNPQRRFVEGVQVPLAILASWGVVEIIMPRLLRARWIQSLVTRPRYSPAGMRRWLLSMILIGICLFNVYLYLGTVATLGFLQPYPLFRPNAEVAAMTWLGEHSNPTDIVLSTYWSGSYIPSQSGNIVYVGQRFETIDFEQKKGIAHQFFSNQVSASWRRNMLIDNHIAYIYVGPHELEFGDFSPTPGENLELVYQNEEVSIYQVK